MSEINFCNTKEQLNHLGEVVTGKTNGSPSGADIDTSTLPYTGQVRKTLPALEAEFDTSIANKEVEADAAINAYRLLNKGGYVPGLELTSKFEYLTYNEEVYFATNPPYTTTAVTPDLDTNLFIGGYINQANLTLYTTLVYRASGNATAIENAVAGIPVGVSVGESLQCENGTILKRISLGDSIENFSIMNNPSPYDWGVKFDGSDESAVMKGFWSDTGMILVPEGKEVLIPTFGTNALNSKVVRLEGGGTIKGVSSPMFTINGDGGGWDVYKVNFEDCTGDIFSASGSANPSKLHWISSNMTNCKAVCGAGMNNIEDLIFSLSEFKSCQSEYIFESKSNVKHARITKNKVLDLTSTTSTCQAFLLGKTQLADQGNTGNYYINKNTFDGITANGANSGEVHAIIVYGSYAHIHHNTIKNIDRPNGRGAGGVEGIYTKIVHGQVNNNICHDAGLAAGNKGAMINIKGQPLISGSPDIKGYFLDVSHNTTTSSDDGVMRNGIRVEGDRLNISDNITDLCSYGLIYAPAGDGSKDVTIDSNNVYRTQGPSAYRLNCVGENITISDNNAGEPHSSNTGAEFAFEYNSSERSGEIRMLVLSGNNTYGSWDYSHYMNFGTDITIRNLVILGGVLRGSTWGVRTIPDAQIVSGMIRDITMYVTTPFRDAPITNLTYVSNYNDGALVNP